MPYVGPVVLNLTELHVLLDFAEEQRDDRFTFLLAVPFDENPNSMFPAAAKLAAAYDPFKKELMVSVGADRPLDLGINPDGPVMEDGALVEFHIRKLGGGVWALSPSLNIPGVLHAFVVVHGVPDPAPWERLVLLASEVA